MESTKTLRVGCVGFDAVRTSQADKARRLREGLRRPIKQDRSIFPFIEGDEPSADV